MQCDGEGRKNRICLIFACIQRLTFQTATARPVGWKQMEAWPRAETQAPAKVIAIT